MPKFIVTGPDKSEYEISAPDGAQDHEVLAYAQQQFADRRKAHDELKAAHDAETARQADPVAGMSTADKLLAGAGKAFSDMGTGAQQIAAPVMDAVAPRETKLSDLVTGKDRSRSAELKNEVADERKLSAPLMDTTAAKVGYVAPALASMAVPGANTVTGAAVAGGALGALQPTGEGESRLLNTAGGAAAGAVGQKVGEKVTGWVGKKLAERATARASAEAANAPKDAILAAGKEAGYVVPPTQANPTLLNKTLEGVAGKISTAQAASAKNQATTNRLTALGLRLPHDEPITPAALKAVREEAGKAYEKVASGSYVTDATFKTRLAELSKAQTTLAAEVPELANKDVINLVKSLDRDKFDGRTLVEVTKALREKATAAYKAGETEAGRFYKGTAHEVENLIERNLLYTGSGGKETRTAFKEARQLIAKSHAAEAALNPATGNINAATFAAALKKGKPMTGEMRQVAEFAGAFPKAAQLPERIGSQPGISPLDAAVAVLKGGAGGVLTLGARPAARAAILSKAFQKMSATPNYSAPIADRLAGGAVADNRLTAAVRAALPSAVVTRGN